MIFVLLGLALVGVFVARWYWQVRTCRRPAVGIVEFRIQENAIRRNPALAHRLRAGREARIAAGTADGGDEIEAALDLYQQEQRIIRHIHRLAEE